MLRSGGNNDDTRMMTPQTKRFKNESSFGMDSPFLTGEIFIPTDIDKLRKLFPLIDSKQLEEVLLECDKNCSKAYDKIIMDKNFQAKEDGSQKALLNKRVGLSYAPLQQTMNLNQSSVRDSKKRRRNEFEGRQPDNGQGSDQSYPGGQGFTSHNQQHNLQPTHQIQEQVISQQRDGNQESSKQISQGFHNQPIQIQEKPLEEQFSENAIKELMNAQNPDQAYSIIFNMVKVYTQKVADNQVFPQEDILKGLLKENSILKKGVRIQNDRYGEALQKAAQYDQLLQEATKQAEEIGSLRAQNQYLYSQLIKKPMYHNWMPNNKNNDFHGGDPMVQ